MAESEYVLTQAGKEQLEAELAYLEGDKRAEVGERIRVAREFGDISENSEYDDAKNEQAMVETRIAEINHILSQAVIVDAPVDDDRIHIGSTVVLDWGGSERSFTIVGGAESNVREGKISNESPVGAALLGHKEGDEVDATGPTGREIHMKVLRIEQ